MWSVIFLLFCLCLSYSLQCPLPSNRSRHGLTKHKVRSLEHFDWDLSLLIFEDTELLQRKVDINWKEFPAPGGVYGVIYHQQSMPTPLTWSKRNQASITVPNNQSVTIQVVYQGFNGIQSVSPLLHLVVANVVKKCSESYNPGYNKLSAVDIACLFFASVLTLMVVLQYYGNALWKLWTRLSSRRAARTRQRNADLEFVNVRERVGVHNDYILLWETTSGSSNSNNGQDVVDNSEAGRPSVDP